MRYRDIWAILLFAITTLFSAFSQVTNEYINRCLLAAESLGTHYTVPVKARVVPLSYKYTITAYTSDPLETDSNPFVTAILERPRAGATCAVSRDLLGWLGGRIYIEGLGVYRVNDLMHSRHSETIDLYMDYKTDAIQFGVQTRKVVFLEGKFN